MRREGVPSPTIDRLAALVDGRIDADAFTAAVTAPHGRFRRTGTPPAARDGHLRRHRSQRGTRLVGGLGSCAVDRSDKARLDADFTELYKAHLRDVYSYAYYRVGNHHDAEDLTEQTFLQAYRHFERAQAESDGRPLRPWLIRIAHNLAANLYRDRSRRPQTPLDDTTMLSALHTTEDLVEGRDELARIIAGIQKLPDERRDALIMRFALGMDNREIARAMGKTDGATKVLLHRAIKQLEGIVTPA